MYKRILTAPKIILISIIIFIIASYTKGPGQNNTIETLLGTASFIYGSFLAFSIATSHSRFSDLIRLLKASDGRLLFLYQISQIYGNKVQGEIRNLIGKYLETQLDYFLVDFRYSHDSYSRLFNYIIKIKPKNTIQEINYDNMIEQIKLESNYRKSIESLVKSSMSNYEWWSLSMLLLVILFTLFYINTGTLLSVIVISLLAITATILLLVLKDLDALHWKEQYFIWDPLEDLFKELDLLPYYPEGAIRNKRVKPKKGKIRVAYYPDKYPDMSHKKVKIIEQS